jgi:hypothetical protein
MIGQPFRGERPGAEGAHTIRAANQPFLSDHRFKRHICCLIRDRRVPIALNSST